MKLGGATAVAAALSTIAAPAFADAPGPICADRPGKANPTCIVPPGMVQVETGLADWTRDRSGAIASDEIAIGGTAVKFGLTDRLHIELDVAPYISVRGRSGGAVERVSGFGDSGVALKYRLTDAAAPVQVALYPFVKIPTAGHSLGNGKVEGGVAVLADATIPGTAISVNIAPQLDLVADGDGSGYHLGMVQVASVGVPLSSRFSVSGELWAAWDFDPAATVRQYSLDGAAAYLVGTDVQLDGGVNLGLNRATPDVEIYAGIAVRF